ncbi:hypothetical protein V9L05_02030 [Bernardetia sp. Wsw4-3y2]|uniref:hypothetical protein n=1 Tax=Bernardetia sp. Wsw4-3y2 TaxID=3127471 RepID=UPI0030CDB5F0
MLLWLKIGIQNIEVCKNEEQAIYKTWYWFNNRNIYENTHEKIKTLYEVLDKNTPSTPIPQKELQSLEKELITRITDLPAKEKVDWLRLKRRKNSVDEESQLTKGEIVRILRVINKIQNSSNEHIRLDHLYSLRDILKQRLDTDTDKSEKEFNQLVQNISLLFAKLTLTVDEQKEVYEKINSALKQMEYEYNLTDDIQVREIYRQIRFVLERQGDKIASLKFKSVEMETHKNEVINRFQYKWYHDLQDKIILLSGWTNDFGRSWFKPVRLMIPITIFFYFLIITGVSNKLSYCPNLFSIQSWYITLCEYCNYINIMPQLLDPTHSLSRIFIDNKYITIGFWAYFFDYFYKVILAFFIFQVISAFRKYVS